LEENKGLVERLIHLWERAMGMVMVANRQANGRAIFGHSVPRCHMLSVMPCLGFEALIIKQVIRVYS
jgi:hypothetical protein